MPEPRTKKRKLETRDLKSLLSFPSQDAVFPSFPESDQELAEDIYLAKDVASREGTDQMAEFGQVASFMVLRVNVDDDVAGYLVFDNLTGLAAGILPPGMVVSQIPLAVATDYTIEPQFISLRDLDEGTYSVWLQAKEDGDFHLS